MQQKYIGYSTIEQGKHLEAGYFFYYDTYINGKKRFVNVKIHK